MNKLTIIGMMVWVTVLGYALFSVVASFEALVFHEAIKSNQTIPQPFTPRFTPTDVQCMAENIYYEARGESVLGRLAVAQVTLNRWQAEPKRSICGIVYERNKNGCQFSWVCDRSGSPKGLAWFHAKQLAEAVLLYDTRCPAVADATFFHTIDVHPAWAKKHKRISTIGRHIFYA